MMKRIALITLGCAALTIAVSPAFAQDAKVKKGADVFVTAKCTKCHSIAGKGNAKGKLDDVATKLTPADIRSWIETPEQMAAKAKETRKPPMKKTPLSKDDEEALIAYLSTLKK
jgi:mono/diheme cytochrome c family protein